MNRRTKVLIAAGCAVLVAVIAFGIFLSRQRLRRHRVFRAAPSEEKVRPPRTVPPIDQWSETFRTLAAGDLAELLEQIAERHPEEYKRYALGYLHARASIEDGEEEEARSKLQPFLQPDHMLRDLALYHQSEIAEAEEQREQASELRQELITRYPRSSYRQQAIEEEAEYLAATAGLSQLADFITRVTPSIDTQMRRQLSSLRIGLMMRGGQTENGLRAGLALLEGSTGDDAADRVSRLLDQPPILNRLTADQKALLGETFQSHRHFDRAVNLLSAALAAPGLAPTRRDELRFALGRSYFGNEKYSDAEGVYLRGANTSTDGRWKATFLFHASRAAQLRGDDATGERLLTSAIAVRGNFPATSAALTQRIRTRVNQKRLAEASSDLQLLQRIAPNSRAIVEGSLALALGMLAAGNAGGALSVLNAVPGRQLDRYDVPEFHYWKGRALEGSDAPAAFRHYLEVLRSDQPTHFAYFARERLDNPAMAPKLRQELRVREAQVTNLVASKQYELARRLQTDRILLSSENRQPALQRLAEIYRAIPRYREVMELSAEPLPKFPLEKTDDRGSLLMAMSLFDEAVEEIQARYPLRPPRAALTRSLALNLGSASRESIYAVEVLMRSVPDDYVPDLLPATVRQLLYPRYFYSYIEADSERYEADPTLVLSIMREESRFNPRAKSAAAARGLLQFIITTARDIGRAVGLVEVEPEDLYDPRVIITLGAKYVSTLSKELGGNHYQTAAAYNAGPNQVRLWTRLAPAEGDDWFLSSINFDETKHYVRKVMNSYKRYRQLYAGGGPAGGIRIEP